MAMDIVQRLRCVLKGNPDAQKAADEIVRLRGLLRRAMELRAALDAAEKVDPVGCWGDFANCKQPCTAKGEMQERQRIQSEPGFYDGYKCGQKDAYALNREYEELRAIIDNGSESMTHEDAVRELKRLMAEDEERAKAEPVAWMYSEDTRGGTGVISFERLSHYRNETPLYTHPAPTVPKVGADKGEVGGSK